MKLSHYNTLFPQSALLSQALQLPKTFGRREENSNRFEKEEDELK
jgi:hypothetical protein